MEHEYKLRIFARVSRFFIGLSVLALAAATLVYLYVDEVTYSIPIAVVSGGTAARKAIIKKSRM